MNDALVETTVDVGSTPLVVLHAGGGKPLLMLHDELGFPGWMRWNQALATEREQLIPLQPGFGRSERLEWARDYRDLAVHYARLVRLLGTEIDVVAFSAGAYLAAEMAVIDPSLFGRMVLVGPLGCRPLSGEIFDFFAVPARTHVAVTVGNQDAPEFAEIYGGEMDPEQFLLFEKARAETARLGWEPFMFDPALPELLKGVPNETLLLRGAIDEVSPQGCVDAYAAAMPNATTAILEGVGHRPEIENPDRFVAIVRDFLTDTEEG